MDKALFVGNNAERNSMRQLEIITNNLANSSTTGFREDLAVMEKYAVNSQAKNQTRSYSMINSTQSNFQPGPIIRTDRDLDVAISGEGFFTVQSKSGKEAYTRAGDLEIQNGILTSKAGDIVLGTSGPISLGNAQKMSIGPDGTISVLMPGEKDFQVINQLKLTKPPISELHKDNDGLFYTSTGQPLPHDNSIKLQPRALEGSNVNPIMTLTNLIEISREFEINSNFMKTLDGTAAKSNEVLDLSR